MLSKDLQLALKNAHETANQHKNGYVTLEYLLLALCQCKSTVEALSSCRADVQELQEKLRQFIADHPIPASMHGGALGKLTQGTKASKAVPTIAIERVMKRAEALTRALMSETSIGAVQGDMALFALMEEDDSYAVYFINLQGISKEDLADYLYNFYGKRIIERSKRISLPGHPAKGLELPKRGDSLSDFTINFNEEARGGKVAPLIGRTVELTKIIQVLARQSKNNPILVGESGVGKTALIRGLALAIEEGEVPQSIADSQIYSLDWGSLMAGTRYRGDFEERIKSLTTQLEKKKNAILFVDDVHSLTGTGSSNYESSDAFNLFKPITVNGKIRCVAATSHEHYRGLASKPLLNHFQKVVIKPMSFDSTYRVLEAIRPRLEAFHGVRYDKEALRAAIALSDRHIYGRHQPDKAVDVLDEAGSCLKVARESHFMVGDGFGSGGISWAGGDKKLLNRLNLKVNFRNEVGEGDSSKETPIGKKEIQQTVANMTGLPLESLREDAIYQLKNLEKELGKKIFGQDKAIKQLVSAVKVARAGLNQPHRPLGCYMLAGPTGVGKTEVCIQLARCSGINLIRYDMSEYSERHAVARLIGAPPGYVGFDTGSQLTTSVMKAPHSIVLFDEMEKAHPNVYNLLLQIMDYGYLTDNAGYKCNFHNTIIIVTTNAGAAEMQRQASGFAGGPSSDGSQAIINTFSPEFRNRLDTIIKFEELSSDVMEKVAMKFMEELQDQLAEKDITMEMSAEARKWLARNGYDPLMGARPLVRLLKEQVKVPLADMLLFGGLGASKGTKEGTKGGVVKISVKQDQIVLSFIPG